MTNCLNVSYELYNRNVVTDSDFQIRILMSRNFVMAGIISVLLIAGCDKDTGTKPNNLPYTPANPSPSNGATDQPTDVDLSWSGGDPDSDPVTYDLYLGTKSSPPLVATGLAQTTYDPGFLNYDTQYYWRIVSHDDRGGEIPGPVWTFRTGTGAGYGNIVEIESVYVSSGSDVEVKIFFENNVELAAVTIPLQYSSNDVVCDSVSFIGSRIEYLSVKGSNLDLSDRLVLSWGLVMYDSLIPTGSGLLGKIYFTIPHPVNTVVTMNSTFFPPATELKFVDYSAASITPQFVPGKIVIDTQ